VQVQDMVMNYVVDIWQKTLASAHSRSTKVSEKDVIFLLRKVSIFSSGTCKSNCEGFWHLFKRMIPESIALCTALHITSCFATALAVHLQCSVVGCMAKNHLLPAQSYMYDCVEYKSCACQTATSHVTW
jgi:hypothetical protein